ncbi:hypothetical protein HH920_000043 [Escherichia coli]|nr:hypothetical protein [Escherichia coli]
MLRLRHGLSAPAQPVHLTASVHCQSSQPLSVITTSVSQKFMPDKIALSSGRWCWRCNFTRRIQKKAD